MPLFNTPLLPIIDCPADDDHCYRGRLGFVPRIIVMHHTAGTDSRKWLSTTSPLDNPVSTHRLIDKYGRNIKIVADEDTAYCAGFGIIGAIDPDRIDPKGVAPNLNFVSLHIELENLGTGKDPYPQVQMSMAADQVVEWWGKYGLLPVLGHAEVDPIKNDPKGFDWQLFYTMIWQKIKIIAISERMQLPI